MSELDHTHRLVVKTQVATEFLLREWDWFGKKAVNGETMSQGDALVLRDSLQQAGFQWGTDFYLQKVAND